MNIGLDIRMLGSQYGGIGRYVLQLVKHLLEIDSQNFYYLFYNNDCQAEIAGLPARRNAFFIPVNIRHYSLAEQLKFPTILKKYQLDLMHFPNFNVPLTHKRPFVVTIHDLVHHKISGAKKSRLLHFLAYKKVISSAVQRSRKIITVSECSKTDISKILKVASEKIRVIYEGISVNTNVTRSKITEVLAKYYINKPYFLFVGVLERKKNIINLTRGFDTFSKNSNLDMDLVLAGKVDRHYPEIKHKALDIAHKNRLVFTDYVEEQDLAALYTGAYAFVSSSLHEGFGLPGVEAMRFGLPLAVSDIPVFNEIYDNAAVYFNPLDPNDIAERLGLLAKDKKFYEQLSKKALERSKLFDWRKTAEETLAIYQECLPR